MSLKNRPKKFRYYTVDTGFLGAPVKLCFDKDAFQDILKDHNINTKETALGLGVAETHAFTEGRNGLIVAVFDYEELVTDEDFSNVFATVTHEAVHIVQRIFEWIGEEDAGEEIHAYLTEWIVKQILKGFTTERDKRHARKANRKTTKRPSKEGGGSIVQVDQLSERSAGPISISELTDILSRIENANRNSER
jgi:hypothetical protein